MQKIHQTPTTQPPIHASIMHKPKEANTIIVKPYHTPCGTLLLGSLSHKLCLCHWQTKQRREHAEQQLKRKLHASLKEGTSETIEEAMLQLHEYFTGSRQTFSLPLLLIGTEFQKTVWRKLLQIPFGETISYAQTALRIGSPRAVRAVANAIAANPLAVFVPCHRVIGSNNSLTGYAGGTESKRKLLLLEGTSLPKQEAVLFP